MNLVPVLASLFVFLFLAALVGCLVPYFRFRHSREKRWATQVLHLVRDADDCIRSENQQIRELKKERDAKVRSLREEAFAAHLCEYSVDELEAYPGIGPGTVGKLRTAGFVNLAKLHRARINVHGLGEKRLADIDYAVRSLLGKARAHFDAGSCRQAQILADQSESLSTRYDRLETEARTRTQAAEDFIEQLGESIKYARAVTFWRWVRPISKEALIPDELIDAPLPDLEAALQAAEQRIALGETSNHTPTPVKANPPSSLLAAVKPANSRKPDPASPAKDECRSLLEIPAGTSLSADLVRRQWNLLSERLAPEKVASMGADVVKIVQEKLAAVRRAAEMLLETMGEKLEARPSAPPVQDLRHNPDLDDVFGGM